MHTSVAPKSPSALQSLVNEHVDGLTAPKVRTWTSVATPPSISAVHVVTALDGWPGIEFRQVPKGYTAGNSHCTRQSAYSGTFICMSMGWGWREWWRNAELAAGEKAQQLLHVTKQPPRWWTPRPRSHREAPLAVAAQAVGAAEGAVADLGASVVPAYVVVGRLARLQRCSAENASMQSPFSCRTGS